MRLERGGLRSELNRRGKDKLPTLQYRTASPSFAQHPLVPGNLAPTSGLEALLHHILISEPTTLRAPLPPSMNLDTKHIHSKHQRHRYPMLTVPVGSWDTPGNLWAAPESPHGRSANTNYHIWWFPHYNVLRTPPAILGLPRRAT